MTIGKYPKTATLPSLGRKGTVPVASASGESGATAQQEPCPACLKELSLLRSGIILPGSMGQPGVSWRCPLGAAPSQMTQWNIGAAATRCVLSPSRGSLRYPGHSLAPPRGGGRWKMRKREGAQPPTSLSPGHCR